MQKGTGYYACSFHCELGLPVVQCGNGRCNACKFIILGDKFTSCITGKTYSINYQLNCNSSNVIYLLCCKICGIQYVGSTTTRFRLRFKNHKSRLRVHARLSINDKEKGDPLYRHFYGPGHNGLEDVSVQLID